MKRAIAICAGAMIAITAVVGVVLLASLTASRTGVGGALGLVDLRDLLGRRIIGVVNANLVPDITFETIDYRAPTTVHLTGVRLTAPDGLVLVRARELTLTLTEAPRKDGPIRFEAARVVDGELNLIFDPETGDLLGFDETVEPSVLADRDSPPPEFRLSEVLAIERLDIVDLDLTIDRHGGDSPMVIEGFSVGMDLKPTDTQSEIVPLLAGVPGAPPPGDGWYDAQIVAGRAPGLELDLEGVFNVDTYEAWIGRGELAIGLDSRTVDSLPREAAAWFRGRNASGDLRLRLAGVLRTESLSTSEIVGELELERAGFSWDRYLLSIDSLHADASIRDGTAALRTTRLDLMDGTGELDLSIRLGEPDRPVAGHAALNAVRLERLIVGDHPEASGTDLAGELTAAAHGSTTLASPSADVRGGGEVRVREGRLVEIPGLAQLAEAAKVVRFGAEPTPDHTADILVEFTPGGMEVTESELMTSTLGARGTGLIGWDGSLDLSVNAGPFEMLPSALGVAKRLFSSLADRLIAYRITGTLEQPVVRVNPLGLGG